MNLTLCFLQTLLTVDSAQLRDEEGKTVIHCAAEQGNYHEFAEQYVLIMETFILNSSLFELPCQFF